MRLDLVQDQSEQSRYHAHLRKPSDQRRNFIAVSIFPILASCRQQRRAAAGPRAGALGSRLHSWPHVGRAVRACCDDARAGRHAWQAIVPTGRRPVGPGVNVHFSGKAVSRGLNLESNAFGSLLLLADNYNPTTDDRTTQGTERIEDAQRHFSREILCSLQLPILATTGSSAGQPQGRVLGRSGPGCCSWPPVGRAVQACGAVVGGNGLPGERS